jgi:hypothetical protein
MRAWFCATAVGSCSFGTTCGSAADSERLKKTNMEPSTNATATTCASSKASSASAIARLASASVRTASATIIVRFRSQRSTSAPAGR